MIEWTSGSKSDRSWRSKIIEWNAESQCNVENVDSAQSVKRKERQGKDDNDEKTDNKIGVEGAKAMSEMLKVNTTLIYLNLGSEKE